MSYNNNKFLQAAFENSNVTTTTNGAKAYNSTLSRFLDFYYFVGSALPSIKKKTTFDYFNERSAAVREVIEQFDTIFAANPDFALRLLYELRDVRSPIGGRGKKNSVALIYRHLATTYPLQFVKQFENIVEYGSWKDLLWLAGTPVERQMIQFWWKQISKDLNSEYPSLAAKWFPSENAGKRSALFYQKFVEVLKLRPGFIRKVVSSLRQKIEIVESKMSAQDWKEIEYSNVPSRASKIYAKAFTKHDEVRYTRFLKSVERGEQKMNVAHVEMFELFKDLSKANQAQFNEIVKMIKSWIPDGASILPVVDTSGSMNSWNIGYSGSLPSYSPMQLAIGCGVALSLCSKGKFERAMYEFNTNPRLHYLPDMNFRELSNYIERKFNWSGSTNLVSVFNDLLKIAKQHNLSNDDLPQMIVVLSDMQFNGGIDSSAFEKIKKLYKEAGFEVPLIVWWNINASSKNVPVTFNEVGTIMVSGYTQNIIKTICTGAVMPIQVVKTIVEHERYNKVVW